MSRLIWAIVLFACISAGAWLAGLVVFGIAALSDWLDGVWARNSNQMSVLGRNIDPLVDKVLVCGAFVFLLPVEGSGLAAWMVTVVVTRELLVTGLRGVMETSGRKFGAGPFGKAKMILQCAALVAILLALWRPESLLEMVKEGAIWAMLVATIGSGIEYFVRAALARD